MGDIISIENGNKKKKINLKHLYIYMDQTIFDSLNAGNLHLFFTINFEKEIKEKDKIKEKISELEEKMKKIELISWYNIITELNKNNNYHLHGIIAIKSLIGYNNVIEKNISHYLINNYEVDSKIKTCWNFIDIKKSWRYLYKDYEEEKKEKETKKIKKEEENFNNLDPMFKKTLIKNTLKKNKEENEKEKKIKINLKKKINIIKIERKIENWFDNIKKEVKISFLENNNWENFYGSKIEEKNYNEKQIYILWDYFLLINDMIVSKEKIYIKVKNYMISYQEFKNIEFLYDDINKIFFFYKKNFPFQFESFDELNFILKFVKNKEEKIKRFKEFTSKKEEFNYNILEFKDGIYSITHNKFIRTTKFNKNYINSLENILKEKKIITVKWYNQSFENLSEPENWLKNIEKSMGLKDRTKGLLNKIVNFLKEDDIEWLLIYLAYVFHYSSNELNKKNTLYIWGPSNTGKTTLIINLFINYFGESNIGLLSGNKNFEYQHLMDKNLIILDEFDLEKINIDNFKKLLSKELVLGEKKGKNTEIIKPTPIIISTNYELKNKLIFNENKEAITNRLKTINFKEQIKMNDLDNKINEKIKEEEAKIIVYCNKIYFKWIKKGKKTRMNDIKLIESI